MHAPNQISLAAKASGEPEFREIGVGPWAETHPGEPRPDDQTSANYDARFDTELLNDGDRRNVLDRYRYWTVQAIKDDLDAHGRHDFEVAVENWTHDFNIGSMVRTANAFQARRVHIVGPHKWNRKGALMTELYQHVEHHPSIAELVECWHNRIAGEIAAERARAAAAAIHIHEYGANASVAGSQSLIPNSFDASNTSNAGGISLVQNAMAELADADNRIKELQSARVIALDIIPGAVPMETYRFPKRCLLLFGAEGPGLSQKALDLADDVVYISQFGSVRSINAGAAAAVAMHAWIAQHATIAS
ncbi:RNA methyltransferase, TrmH family [Bifidobacterium saguini DSM 23967]|uniref:RNA methyltransferase, TrmH family n=2 Tax=Bifidobacterium saguini TaxID=762210 RepID=A0A087DB48_9BIFI|nr:TrmH family RNA methyltransferase [Bifidobacterium saguini]KFI92748.1 RNA methyltransferase, TrmH family [Bifidobacterium saguini DSM 23967]QTB91754.1 RNA methyltransferase [Bifidobacterium saguini]